MNMKCKPKSCSTDHTEIVHNAYRKAQSIPRLELLQRKKKRSSKQNQAYFVTKYSPLANPIKRIIHSNWNLIKSDPVLREVFCGSCNHCSNINECKQFCDFKTNKMHNIKAFINCNTTFVVYRLSCKCGCFYVGRTKRHLTDRISEHKNAIKKDNLDYPMAKHFQNVHNSNPEGQMVEGLETIKKNVRGGDRLKLLLQRETLYIYIYIYIWFTGHSVPWVEWRNRFQSFSVIVLSVYIYLFGLGLLWPPGVRSSYLA